MPFPFKKILWIPCLFFLLSSKGGEYPTPTIKMEILDEKTELPISNVNVESEIFYEYIQCQDSMAPPNLVKALKNLLDKGGVPENERGKYERQVQELEQEVEQLRLKNKIPVRDTFVLTAPSVWTIRMPLNSYKIKFSHPEYDTLEIENRFPHCQMSVYVKADMKRRE